MARIARVVAPGIPHHVTQRGNRRQPTFFQPSDYQYYLGGDSVDSISNSKDDQMAAYIYWAARFCAHKTSAAVASAT